MQKIQKVFFHKIVAVIIFGDGLLNVLAASQPPLGQKVNVLLKILPWEFIYWSNFLSLLMGMFLSITAFNLYRRKKRAWQYAMWGLGLSIIFNLTRGLNYLEMIFSLLIGGVLWMNRKEYTVKSKTIDLKNFGLKLGLVYGYIFMYGMLGFLMIDKQDIRNKSSWQKAGQQTIENLFWLRKSVSPQIGYKKIFIQSLRWANIAIGGLFFWSLFGPVLLQEVKSKKEIQQAKKLRKKYGQSRLDYFKVWPDKEYFFAKDKKSFISYIVNKGVAIALEDPVGEKESKQKIIKEFEIYCQQQDWKFGFYHVKEDSLSLFRKMDFKSFKIGDEAIIDLNSFSLQGGKKQKIRQTINKLKRLGYNTTLYQPPLHNQLLTELALINKSWLSIQGRREGGFSMGCFENNYIRHTAVMVVEDKQGHKVAFANIVPSYKYGEATVDLIRHKKESMNGVMDFLIINLINYFKERHYLTFSLGLAPLSGFKETESYQKLEKSIHQLAPKLNFLFSFKGLAEFKAKYAHIWEPRYLVYKKLIDLPFIVKTLSYASKKVKSKKWEVFLR